MMKIERRSAAAQAAAAAPSASVALSACPLTPLAVVQFINYSHTDEDEDEDGSWWSLLPEDIVAEILLRLPIKPLFKLKSISKRYESIISDQEFAKRYLQRVRFSPGAWSSSGIKAFLLYPSSKRRPNGLSKNVKYLSTESLGQDEDESSISVCYCSPRPKGVGDLIQASSNGLILSLGLGTRSRFDLHISNPLTKQWVPIPEPREPTEHYDLLYCIATRRESYKIVIIRRAANGVRLEDNAETTVEIFCSVTGRWAAWKVVRCPGEVFYESAGKAVFSYKGVLHWLARGSGMVITYDPYDNPDRFGCIPLPKRRYPHLGYTSLIYSGDEEVLKYCEMDKGGSGFDRLMVWRLVNDNSEWCMEGEFRIPSLHHPCCRLMVALNPCNPDVICHPYVIDCKVMVVNLRTRTWKLVDVFDPSAVPFMYSESTSYINLPFIRVELCPWSSPFYKLS